MADVTDVTVLDYDGGAVETAKDAVETLRSLRDRLTRMIERNERGGYRERNEMPVAVTLIGKTPGGRRKQRYYRFGSVWGGMFSIGIGPNREDFGLEIVCHEADRITVPAALPAVVESPEPAPLHKSGLTAEEIHAERASSALADLEFAEVNVDRAGETLGDWFNRVAGE